MTASTEAMNLAVPCVVSVSPTMSAAPTTSTQTIVTVVAPITTPLPFSDGHTYRQTIETATSGEVVFEATVAPSPPLVSSPAWSGTVLLEDGVEYVLTITDSRGDSTVDAVQVYLGNGGCFAQHSLGNERCLWLCEEPFVRCRQCWLLWLYQPALRCLGHNGSHDEDAHHHSLPAHTIAYQYSFAVHLHMLT